MLIKEIMKKPIAIDKDITLEQASKIMTKQDINSLLIVKKEMVIGVITYEDLVKNFGKKLMVSNVMSKDIVFIRADDKVHKAIEIIKKRKISILPVLDGKNNLVGVVHVKELLTKSTEDEDFLLD